MIFNLKNDYDKQRFKDYCNKLYTEGCAVELTKKRANRSLPQNAYLHLILGWFACEKGYSIDEVKVDFFKRECNRVIFEQTKINKKGEEITSLRSSKELDTAEMTTAIDRFRNWSASVAELYLPAPNEHEMLLYAEQIIEQNKEFI